MPIVAAPVSCPPRRAAGLDPDLPGLAGALDGAAVTREFERLYSATGPAQAITAAVAEHVRWTPGIECVATYRLSFAPSPGHANSTIGSVVVTAADTRLVLFDADPDLPGLAAATDPAVMAGWFARRLGRSVDACSIAPVTHRLGSRCVLRYDLTCGSEVVVLYGKLRSGAGSRELAATLAALGDPLVPRLVAVAPEWQLVVAADGGRRSHGADRATIVPTAAVVDEFDACGRLLAGLHVRRGPPGELRRLSDDLGALARYLPAAHRADAVTAARSADLIELLRAQDATPPPAVPSHGAFREDQVRFGPRGPAMIDLDSYCWAEPARDVANFLAYLRWRAIRRHDPAAGAELRAAFLDAYRSQAGASPDPHRLRLFEAASLLKIAGRRYRRVAIEEWGQVPALIDAAHQLVTGEQMS